MEFEKIKITDRDGVERIEERPLGDTEYRALQAQKIDHEIAKALARGAGADEIRAITDRGLPERPAGEIIPFSKDKGDQAKSG